MDKNEQVVIDFFSLFDLQAEKIPESEEKTPDFFLESNGKKILIELKTKLDDSNLLKKQEEVYRQSKIFEHIDVLERKNSISGRTKKAYKQLSKQKKVYNADFCFVSFLIRGQCLSNQYEQILSTLFGSKNIVLMGDDFDNGIKKCYYYSNSDFFNYKDILDGAFIIINNSYTLCINTHSVNYKELKKSEFLKLFNERVLDPLEQEVNGKAYILDSAIPRDDKNALNEYLCKKYGLKKIVPFDCSSFTFSSKIEISDHK